ncbi:MAG: hypothetical protein J5809_08805 [Selenomonadaceae bacterium]|nr:hypothetical protein [Selenomonadaceae bacterium]
MLKKILIGVGILAVLGVAGFVLVVMNASSRVEEAFKAKEPEFRQYVTMSVPEQNAYVEKNMREIMNAFGAKFDDAEFNEFVSKLESDPEAKTAGIELGRSIIADYILDKKSMADVINDENRVWLKADSDASEARSNRYAEIIDKLDPTKK